MNRADFLKTANGGNGLYPLSLQGLDFLQAQTHLLQNLTLLGGKRYLVKAPGKDEAGKPYSGLIVIDGELLPLEPGYGAGICVREEREDIVADGVTYAGARIKRTAYFVRNYVKNTEGLYPVSGFTVMESLDQLSKKLGNVISLRSEVARRLPVVTTKSLTRAQLDAQKENARLCCRKGCVPLNGADEYVVNVYAVSDDSVMQEQILPDNRRFRRVWNPAVKQWGAFEPCGDTLHIDVKIVKGSTVYVRHGHIPEGVKLVLLRKKKRTPKRRSGGANTSNAAFKGKTVLRQPKNQYVHYRGIVLSTSVPGRWYVPKCIGVADIADNNLIGKELGRVCEKMIVPMENGVYRIAGTRKRLAASAMHRTGTSATGYARIALQLAEAGQTFKSAGGEKIRMRYLMWFESKTVSPGVKTTVTRRGFSLE